MIDEFYGADNLLNIWHKYKGRVPVQFLPIGGNVFGDLICLNLAPNEPGIAYWDHEQEDAAYDLIAEIPPLDTVNPIKIADTFAKFIEMLGEIPKT